MRKKVLIGPPGTGKTTAATKIAYERFKEFGNRVGYFAFTKRAAHEAKVRMHYLLGEESDSLDYFRTLHSLYFRQLGLQRDRVFDIEGFAKYAELRCSNKKIDPDENYTYLGPTEDDMLIFHIGLVKAKGMDREKALKSFDGWQCNRRKADIIWQIMDRYKKIRNLWDFHDMSVQFVKRKVFPKLHTIILDEAQDLTFTQRQAFNALCAHNPDALVVEALDADQAIFAWAGSEVNVEELCDNADVKVLGQSYRVPAPVHKLAMSVITECKDRKPVKWLPAKHEGSVERIMDVDSIPERNRNNLLILVRNVCHSSPYIQWLKEHSLHYRFLNNGKKYPIRIGTIHEAKGAEADNVILDLNMTRKSWNMLHTDDEKRVWYTGITRAKKNLYLMMPRARCNAENLLA